MFKTLIKSFGVLACGLTALLLCVALSTPHTASASPGTTMDDPTQTPTTSTPTNATVSLSMPDGSNAQGQPGTKVQITGSGFKASSVVTLYTVTDPGTCTVGNITSLGSSAFSSQAALSADANGSFSITPTWPENANQAGSTYYICAISAQDNVYAVSSAGFTVAQNPTIAIATNTADPGDQVTITGSNWYPAQTTVTVAIANSQGATPIVQQQTSSGSDGSFSITLTIPQNAPGGSYGVYAVATGSTTLKANADNVLTINAQATPTATAEPSPTPTPEMTPTPTPAPTNNKSDGGTSGMTFLIYGLGGLGVILVVIGLTMYISYSHRA